MVQQLPYLLFCLSPRPRVSLASGPRAPAGKGSLAGTDSTLSTEAYTQVGKPVTSLINRGTKEKQQEKVGYS